MKNIVEDLSFALARMKGTVTYPPLEAAPYPPDAAFPEFPGLTPGKTPNPVFGLVREALRELGLDAEHFGTAEWNPLGTLVRPGGKVVVKPNWVLHRNMGDGGMDCMITHPSVLRAVLEYVWKAAPGEVTLGDAPLQGCDFERMLDHGGLRAVLAEFQGRGLPLRVADFRRTVVHEEGLLKTGLAEGVRPESEYVRVDLGADSLLEPISKNWRKFRVTVYDPRKMWRHHRPGRHRYLIARELLEADLVVNCPKLKTHKKAGVTCCLKNLIGINGNKEYLPHHRKGGADARGGGDNYEHAHWKLSLAENLLDFANGHLRSLPRMYRLTERVAWRLMVKRSHVDATAQVEGSWHGNDTIWRTCLDLNRALLYADAGGTLQENPQRQEISIVDAVVAGQGTGPLEPEPLETGTVFAVRNPAVGDVVACRLLGFVPERVALVREATGAMRWRIAAGQPDLGRLAGEVFPSAREPKGWEGCLAEKPTE